MKLRIRSVGLSAPTSRIRPHKADLFLHHHCLWPHRGLVWNSLRVLFCRRQNKRYRQDNTRVCKWKSQFIRVWHKTLDQTRLLSIISALGSEVSHTHAAFWGEGVKGWLTPLFTLYKWWSDHSEWNDQTPGQWVKWSDPRPVSEADEDFCSFLKLISSFSSRLLSIDYSARSPQVLTQRSDWVTTNWTVSVNRYVKINSKFRKNGYGCPLLAREEKGLLSGYHGIPSENFLTYGVERHYDSRESANPWQILPLLYRCVLCSPIWKSIWSLPLDAGDSVEQFCCCMSMLLYVGGSVFKVALCRGPWQKKWQFSCFPNIDVLFNRHVCKPKAVRFSERSVSGFGLGRVKVPTNMCGPKICSASWCSVSFSVRLILTVSDLGLHEDFGGNRVALESQRWPWEGRTSLFYYPLLFKLRQCGAEQMANEGEAELTRGSLESGGWMPMGTEETHMYKEDYVVRKVVVPLLHACPSPSPYAFC